MRWVALAAAAAGLLTVSTAAVAQPGSDMRTGSRFKAKKKVFTQDDARGMQKTVARCVANRYEKEARLLLANSDQQTINFDALPFDSENFYDKLDVAYCIGRVMKETSASMQMSIRYDVLRNLLAEEVYLIDNKDPLVVPANGAAYIEAREPDEGMHPVAVAKAKLADCIVFNDATNSHELARSRPGSKDEVKALTALSAVVKTCAGQEDAKAPIDATVIRLIIADGLWARSHYGSGMAASGAGDTEEKGTD